MGLGILTYNEDLIEADEEFLLDDQPAISNNTILQAQKQDQTIGRVLNFKLEGRHPSIRDTKRELPGTKALLRQWHKLKIGKDGLLHRESGPYKQLVLPRKFHSTGFEELHQEMGHLGAARVVQLARERFLLARHGKGHHSLCHQRLWMPETAKTSPASTCTALQPNDIIAF